MVARVPLAEVEEVNIFAVVMVSWCAPADG